MTETHPILVVDDDFRMCESLEALLDDHGYAVRTCDNGPDAVKLLEAHTFDIVMLDVCMDGMDGFEVMEKTKGAGNGAKFILMSGYHSKELAVQAFKRGATLYLRKPFDSDELLEILSRVVSDKGEMDRLRASERHYRHLAENARDMIYRMSLPEGRYEYVNSAARDITGYPPEAFYEDPHLIRRMMHPDWLEYFREKWAGLLAGDISDFYEYQIVHKDGEERWLNQRNRFFYDGSGPPVAIEGVVSDITEQKRYEKRLKESEMKFRGLFDLSPLPICVTEVKTGRFVDANDEFCKFMNYPKEELVGRGITELGLYPPSDRDRMMKSLGASGEARGLEMNFRIKAGVSRSTLMFSKRLEGDGGRYLISTFYDQTDRENLEIQKFVIQKLEAVATLSGGIAHQFNNALQNVAGNIELLEMELPGNDIVETFCRRTESSTKRMSHLVNQLLAYARGGKYKTESVGLNDFVNDTLPCIARDLGTGIDIGTNLLEGISDIKADSAQLKMVLSAVLANAAEAIEGGGRIEINTGTREVDEAHAAKHPGLKPGAYVCLEVTDSGKGMDEETSDRIFEPFFTTKASGRGLGMSAVYGIVKNHGGYTHVDSNPGKGTTITILLPAI